MKIKQKVGAAVGALALLGGAGLAVAAPAQAAAPDQVWLEHTLDSPRGLGGNLGYSFSGSPGTKRLLREGAGVAGPDQFSGRATTNTPRYVYAGGGYCVWEEVWVAGTTDPNDDTFTFGRLESNNWGKGYASGTRFELGSWKYNNNNPYSVKSKARIYAC